MSEDCQSGHWTPSEWPLAGLAAAGLVAGEAFKAAMRRVRSFAIDVHMFDQQYAPTRSVALKLQAPRVTSHPLDLGEFDCVSAGAIAHATLFALARIPGIRGACRVIDDDVSDLTNLNRNALLRRSRVGLRKVTDLGTQNLGNLRVTGLPTRLSVDGAQELSLASSLLVGVDHIPTRWVVQNARPSWLSIGATSHSMAMVSFHENGLGCARCLHPVDDDRNDDPIPTLSIVSHWAGLMLAEMFLGHCAGNAVPAIRQSTCFWPLRPEAGRWDAPVPRRPHCPVCSEWRTDRGAGSGAG